ncbi:cyclase family protein [Leeuwenhoekiella palythoae]|uniref:Kynurenine formamidase n=1 Tax=Leeuwenhoekiella palythoae TaxID=573501 RepID=A0A1M5WX51_9FLAO|nr:cyclase family protein [Leeuwenhoekiella palythoae]RXG31575.1 kynurenine formamidase [Leeuwenhoekiella palythoae]UBZ09049.1 cyclase family protein [Leeuwenhoekiella palythoae]SHH92236.1 Kynurenine formamidase [Leeuwenhoekiella palythoae]
MQAKITINQTEYSVDFSKPIDLSIPVISGEENPVAWYLEAPKIEPVKEGKWVAAVEQGSVVNFNNVYLNPHAHGTHTECVGHITEKVHSINEHLKTFMFTAEVITLVPESFADDLVFTKKQVAKALASNTPEALVIRTLPNTSSKKSRKWSHTNWPYLMADATAYIKECGVKHLLIDLPSVDRERDEGVLASHKAWWYTGGKIRFDATITEMIYVPHTVKDGSYILNLQIASFENDAAPSKPILYTLES